MKVKVKLAAGKVKSRKNGTCPRGSRHMKGRKGCYRAKGKKGR